MNLMPATDKDADLVQTLATVAALVYTLAAFATVVRYFQYSLEKTQRQRQQEIAQAKKALFQGCQDSSSRRSSISIQHGGTLPGKEIMARQDRVQQELSKIFAIATAAEVQEAHSMLKGFAYDLTSLTALRHLEAFYSNGA